MNLSMKGTFPKKRTVFLSFFLLPSFLLSAPLLSAEEEIQYDPYAPILKHAEAVQPEAAESRDRHQTLARILEQPIRPIGFGIGKSAEWVERKHIDEKAVWFFDELATHGIHPGITGPTEGSFGTIGPRVRIELEKLLQWDQPYLISDASGSWTPNKDFDGSTIILNAHYKIEPPNSAVFQEGLFKYARSSSESFYGTGQDTSLGERSTYKPEEVWLEGSFGFHVTQTADAALSLAYQRMNIGNGARE
ncbi:MAG: hypothetical protein HYS55_01095, partial [Candidatus Omnitrophica bacterium]|nr:hypothetical protein [Candidatus Omnitrophota bacterium]